MLEPCEIQLENYTPTVVIVSYYKWFKTHPFSELGATFEVTDICLSPSVEIHFPTLLTKGLRSIFELSVGKPMTFKFV